MPMISMPKTAEERKLHPVTTGVLDYFPDAILAIANVSLQGNEQHNPGQPLHWDRSKSQDEADALARHLMERGTKDSDGTRHSAKMAWRALALLQKEIEEERGRVIGYGGSGRVYPVYEMRQEYAPGVVIRDECSAIRDPETQEWVDFPTYYKKLADAQQPVEPEVKEVLYQNLWGLYQDSQADGHKDAECEWCGYQQSECECVKRDKGL